MKISKIDIKSFRNYGEVSLTELRQVNIITGDNNTGKTTLLESVYLNCASDTVGAITGLFTHRNEGASIIDTGLFHNFKNLFNLRTKENAISINSDYNNTLISKHDYVGTLDLEREVEEKNMFESTKSRIKDSLIDVNNLDFSDIQIKNGGVETNFTIHEFSRVFNFDKRDKHNRNFDNHIGFIEPGSKVTAGKISRLIKTQKYKEMMMPIIRLFEPDINDILILTNSTESRMEVYLESVSKGLIPLSICGDGIKKLLDISSELIKCVGGILLIDEIETSFHISKYDKVFKFLLYVSEELDIQLFITTHSKEVIYSILKAKKYEGDEKDNINVITLLNEDNKILSREMPGKKVFENMNNFNFEVR